jgi:hypothetical protein
MAKSRQSLICFHLHDHAKKTLQCSSLTLREEISSSCTFPSFKSHAPQQISGSRTTDFGGTSSEEKGKFVRSTNQRMDTRLMALKQHVPTSTQRGTCILCPFEGAHFLHVFSVSAPPKQAHAFWHAHLLGVVRLSLVRH